MSPSLATRLTHSPLRVLVPVVALLAWVTATTVLASHRGAERRMTFDGAVHR